MPSGSNPLSQLSDEEVFNSQLALALACGRAHAAIKGRQKTRLCTLQGLLAIEAMNRGTPICLPPYAPIPRPKAI